jgi:hypothetical protein
VRSLLSSKLIIHSRRQYVYQLSRWGWKKYRKISERTSQSLDSSGHGDVDKDEGAEPSSAPDELARDPGTQRRFAQQMGDSLPDFPPSFRSSSHDHLALPNQHRAHPPRPIHLLKNVPLTIRSEPVPNYLLREDQVINEAEVIQTPKPSGQDSLDQAQAPYGAAKARKSTEHDIGDDMDDEDKARTTKRIRLEPLSCPFRKRNPLRFNVRDHGSCALNSFSDFALLKCVPHHPCAVH